VLEWYKKGFGNSKVRLQGAVDFAKNGLNNVWFALFPADDSSKIGIVEKNIIPIANEWKKRNGLVPLINKQYNNN